MKLKALVMTVIALALGGTLLAQDQARERKLQQAIDLLETKGDAARAMPLLEDVAKSADQSLAARGLLYLGQAQERQGNARARATYERIIQHFGNQSEIVQQARARLNGLGTSPAAAGRTPGTRGLSQRRLYASPDSRLPESISDDGTKLAESGGDSGDIVIRDLTTGRARAVTPQPAGSASNWTEWGERPFLSRDGTQVAYTWISTIQKATSTARGKIHGYIRVSKVRDEGIDTPRVLYSGHEWTNVYDWSPDGRQIAAVAITENRRASIVLISVQDGAVTVLKDVGTGPQPTTMMFSPDGRQLAFDTRGVLESATAVPGDIAIMTLADKTERMVASGAARERLVGWTPDGSRILFTSDQSGSSGLFTVAVPQGQEVPPTLIRGDFGPLHTPLRVASSGSLFYTTVTGGASYVMRAIFDFRTGTFAGEPQNVDVGTSPSWSRDGSTLAYIDRPNVPFGRQTLKLRTVDGSVRGIKPELRNFAAVHWGTSPDVVFTTGSDGAAKTGLWSIDLRTGATTFLSAGARQLQVSADGRRLYFFRGSGAHEFVERDPASGEERVLLSYSSPVAPESAQVTKDGSKMYYRAPEAGASAPQPQSRILERDVKTGSERELFRGRLGLVNLSPDERYIAIKEFNAEQKWVAFKLVSTTDASNVREVMRIPDANHDLLTFGGWAGDGTAVLINQGKTATHAAQTWWVPTSGSAPRRLPHYLGAPNISPDGKTLVFGKGSDEPRRGEVWVLENFMPTAAKK